MLKKLTCSVSGDVEGIIEFNSNEIEKAMEIATEAKKVLGLRICYIKHKGATVTSTYEYFTIVLKKTETPEHFICLAKDATKLGWT